MRFSLKNLNRIIDRWITQKTEQAPDRKYATVFLQKEFTWRIDKINLNKSIIHTKQFKELYHYYKLGNYSRIERLFHSDNDIVGLLSNEHLEQLLKEGKIYSENINRGFITNRGLRIHGNRGEREIKTICFRFD